MMLLYGIFLVNLLGILVFIIVCFKFSVPLEGRCICTLEMATMHELYRIDFNPFNG